MNYEFASPGPVNADIRTAGGAVHLEAGDHDTITVSVEPYDNSSHNQQAAEQTRVALEGRQLVVHAPDGKGWAVFRWPKLNIRVALPKDSTLRLRTASADVTCKGSYQDADLHTASGDVQLERAAKDVSISAASGDVKVGDVGQDVRVTSASGDIEIGQVGGDVEAQSASGDIEIGRAGGDVRAKTASGDVEIGAAHRGEIRVGTASGDVSVGIVAGTGVWLDVSTASGKTTSDLSVGGEAPPTGASLSVRVRTASGDIRLRRVAAAAQA